MARAMKQAHPPRMKKSPVVVVKFRNSERSDFLTCRQKWYWGWVDSLTPIEDQPPLEFGDYIHQALAAYYKRGRKRGPKPATTFEKLVTERMNKKGRFNLWADQDWVDGLELGVKMLEAYVKFAKSNDRHPDDEYEVISSEQTFQLPLGKMIVGGITYKIIGVGTFDGVWRHIPTSALRFPEHKTATKISHDALPMDEQAGMYSTFGPRWLRLQSWFKHDTDLFDGILYNWLRKAFPNEDKIRDERGQKLNKPKKDALLNWFAEHGKVPKSKLVDDMIEEIGEVRAYRECGEVSLVQDAPFFDRQLMHRGEVEAERVRTRLRLEVEDMILARQHPERHVYKNPGPQFMPNCRFCSFRDMCEVHETGNDWEAMIPAMYKKEDKYEAHQLVERR